MEREAARDIRNLLAREERLLWAGRPCPRRLALASIGWPQWLAAVLLPLSALLLAALGAGILHEAMAAGWRMLLTLASIAVFALSAQLLWSVVRCFRDARRTAYGLTDRRALILLEGKRTRVSEIPVAQLGEPGVRPLGSGLSTIIIRSESNAPAARRDDELDFVGVARADALLAEMARIREVRNGDADPAGRAN
jgi:hypothetical protein